MKNQYKTLIIYHYFPHYRLPILKKLSRDKNIDFTFISGEEKDISINLISKEIALRNKLNWRLVTNLWFFRKKILWQKGLLKISLFEKYDCIIYLANPYFLSTWVAMIFSRLRRKKVLLWGHFILRKDIKLPVKLLFYRLADGLLTYGNWAKQELIKKRFLENRIFVVFNSLDYEKQIRIRKSLSPLKLKLIKGALFSNPELPILIFIGRLSKRKRLDLLIEATAKLHNQKKLVNLLFIGDGAFYNELSNLIKLYKLDEYAVFIGETYNEKEIAPLIALSNLCVSPGEIGLAAMHTMVYGIPVISHDNPFLQMPEFEAIIPGKTGDFFKSFFIESLTETIDKWLKKKNNSKLVQDSCQKIIQDHYNPNYQSRIIHKAILYLINNE